MVRGLGWAARVADHSVRDIAKHASSPQGPSGSV
jgi:hypothetical protein